MTITKEIMGRNFTVGVDDVSGEFSASVQVHGNMQYVSDASLPKLVEKIRALIRKDTVRARVLVGIANYATLKNVTLLKIVKGLQVNILHENGDKDQISRMTKCYKPFSEAEKAEYRLLFEAKSAAEKACDDFLTNRLYVDGKRALWDSDADDILLSAVEAKTKELEALKPVVVTAGIEETESC